MSPFDLEQLVILGGSDVPKLWELFARMSFATLFAGAIAFRVTRVILPFVSPPSLPSAQAQTLIAAAGAVMVVVIGDSPARAFGLVGLGSFIRFRSGIRDPRDAAILFVVIGIGMACGLGLFSLALGATLFVCLLHAVFEATRGRYQKPTVVTIQADDAPYVQRCMEQLFPRLRVIESATNAPELGKDAGKLVVGMDLTAECDASELTRTLRHHGVHGVRRVALALEE